MNDRQEDQELRALFSEQARGDRRQAPDFNRTLQGGHRPSLSGGRLALAAGFLLAAGIGMAIMYQSVTRQPAAQAPLPNLLEALDQTPQRWNAAWQSPTAFLLDLSNNPGRSESAPSPGSNGTETRHSNG